MVHRVAGLGVGNGAETEAYLTGRNELQRPQRGLHIRDVGLQVVEGVCDTALELRRLLPRGTCRRDLVEGSHNCGRGVIAVLGLTFELCFTILCGSLDLP